MTTKEFILRKYKNEFAAYLGNHDNRLAREMLFDTTNIATQIGITQKELSDIRWKIRLGKK